MINHLTMILLIWFDY